jgi:hypothetical protein
VRFFRGRRRLRPIGESEAYGRTYGERSSEIRVSKAEPKRPRFDPKVSGESLREAFARRLDDREDEKDT